MCSSSAAELGITWPPFQFILSCPYCHSFSGLNCAQPSVEVMLSVAFIPFWPRSREIGRLLLRCSLAGLATLVLGVGFANFTGTALSFARLFEGRLTLVVLGRDIDRGNKSRWDSYYIFALWHSRSVLTRNRWVDGHQAHN